MQLSMQIFLDSLLEYGAKALGELSSESVLESVRFYDENEKVEKNYLYICTAADVLTISALEEKPKGSFVLVGGADCDLNNAIALGEDISPKKALSLILNTFEYYSKWEKDLNAVLQNDGEISELLELSLPIFNNPIFVHDSDFFLISMMGAEPKETDWVYDKVYNRYIFNSDLINLYKVSPDYMESLSIHGGSIFPEVIRDYSILIVNLWDNNNYVGRICINAINSEIKNGQLQLIEHLGKMVEIALRKEVSRSEHSSRILEIIIAKMIEGKAIDEDEIIRNLSKRGWKINDTYICIKVGVHKRDEHIMSLVAACNRIENIFQDSFAFTHHNNIAVIVNLSRSVDSQSDCLTKLGVFLREGLFKAGSSNLYNDFFRTGDHYRQASAAMNIGSEYDETLWSYRFDHYTLPYFFKYGCSQIPHDLICSRSIMTLLDYDLENNTKFCETLEAYLNNKQNATLTAKALFIHRSTFFYRLDRIKNIINVDFENPTECFHMQLSFMLLENAKKHPGGT